MPGDIAEMAYARAHRIEAAMNTWNTMDHESQQTMERLADGTETLDNLGAATFAELAEYGLVERDGEDGVQWTPLGYEMAGWLEEHGGSDAG